MSILIIIITLFLCGVIGYYCTDFETLLLILAFYFLLLIMLETFRYDTRNDIEELKAEIKILQDIKK